MSAFEVTQFFSCVCVSSYLLGRHKASLDAYTEALKLSPSDWVMHTMGYK